MLPLRKFPKPLREQLASQYPSPPISTLPNFLIATRSEIEIAATPRKQTIDLISNRNIFVNPFKLLTLPSLREISDRYSISSCSLSFLASESFATHTETKIPVTPGKQSSAHSLVRYTSRLSEFNSPALSPSSRGDIMGCLRSSEILNCEAFV